MNKSKLLASTMLVSAAALVGAGSASAAELKFGGFGEFWVGVGDANQAGDNAKQTTNDYDVKTDMEIHFKAEETLDNGIKVGFLAEMESGNGNDAAGGAQGVTDFDETFGWVKTKFGQVNVGNNDPASAYVGGISVVGPVGIIKSDAGDWLPGFDQGLNNMDADLGTGDAQNITYFTPKVGGAQIIVSYAPDSSDGGSSDYDDSETTGFRDAFSGAIKYSAKFGKVGVGLSAGLTHLSTDDSDEAAGGDSEKQDGHNVRGQVKFGPVEVTGAYAFENRETDTNFFGAGVKFSASKMDTISFGWSYSEEERLGSDANEGSLYTVGYERKVGKGISFLASAFYGEFDDRNDTEADDPGDKNGVGFVTGFKIGF